VLSVSDPQNENSFSCSGIDDSIVAHTELVEALELPKERLAAIGVRR
jgi:hypothetical protein